MTEMSNPQRRLDQLKREYRGVRSMIEMMEKGTSRKELQKIRAEKLKPVEEEIKKLEEKLAKG
jgi:hypothetical protein